MKYAQEISDMFSQKHIYEFYQLIKSKFLKVSKKHFKAIFKTQFT